MEHGSGLPDFDGEWDYDRPEATEQVFMNLLPLATSAADEPWRLALLTQIARAQGLQRRFADAHRTLDQVEAALSSQPPRVRMRYLLERGRVFNSSGFPEQAVPLFQEEWEVASAHGDDDLAIDAAHMLGIAAPSTDRLAWNERALTLAEQSRQPEAQRWVGSLLNNIGWTLHDQGRYEEALALFQRAATWRARDGKPAELRVARWCVARTLRSTGRAAEALPLLRELLAELDRAGEVDGYVHEELAECLLILGQPEAARPHAAAAHAMLSPDPWLSANEPDRLLRLQTLGDAGGPGVAIGDLPAAG